MDIAAMPSENIITEVNQVPDPPQTFVVGCSRSGTTPITELLNSHPEIVIGMERFKYEYTPRDDFNPRVDWFRRERFFDFRPSDTNVTPEASVRWAKIYEQAEMKFSGETVRTVGDKVLATPGILGNMAAFFPNARYVFIFRDLARLASSYCVRAANPRDTNWPETKTHRSAHVDWTKAFQAAEELVAAIGPDALMPIHYERLFSGDLDAFLALLAFLGVRADADSVETFASMTRGWSRRIEQPLDLDDEQLEYLDAHADREFESRFIERANKMILDSVA